MRLPWIDLGSHRDASILLKQRRTVTEIRIDSKTERIDITIYASGAIHSRTTWPIPAPRPEDASGDAGKGNE
jgi:hypothetical protein